MPWAICLQRGRGHSPFSNSRVRLGMTEPDWLPESLVFWLWPHLKKRGVGWALTAAVHALAVMLALYVVVAVDNRSPGAAEQAIDVSLTTGSSTKTVAKPQPVLVQPPQSVVVQPPDIVIPNNASLRALPSITLANASQGQSEYLYRLWRFTQRYMQFPRNILLSGGGGVVWVHVVINRAGMAEVVEIDQSSGSPELDAAAITVIKRAQPLPIFPDSLGADYFSTVIRFGYGPTGVEGKMDALDRR